MNDVEYVGFWVRLMAHMVDAFIITILMVILLVSFVLVIGTEAFVASTNDFLADPEVFVASMDTTLIHIISTIVLAFIVVMFWSSRFQGTPGKIIFKARVVDAKTYGQIGIGKSIIRYIAYIPAILCLLIGFIWVAFDQRKQGWHDKIAGTVVIKK